MPGEQSWGSMESSKEVSAVLAAKEVWSSNSDSESELIVESSVSDRTIAMLLVILYSR